MRVWQRRLGKFAEDSILTSHRRCSEQWLVLMVQVYVMRWRMKFNSRKSKIMVVGKSEGGTSWKIEEIM